MKRIVTICAAILTIANLFAQSPEKMSYQAIIRDANSELVTNQTVGTRISIIQATVSGTVVYTETQTPTSNANGLISIEIGTGTTSDDFSGIDWTSGPYFIKTEADPNGGTDYTITGTSQLLSVPYALHSKTAESLTGTINEADPIYTDSEAANITAADIVNLDNLSGTNTGDQDISGIAENRQAIQDTASQIRADMPDVNGFLTSETDPVFTTSQAANITATDISNLSNLSGINTGDQDISGLATKTALGDSTTLVRSEIPDVSGFLSGETDPVYNASVAGGITATDTVNWNNKIDGYTETDPIFVSSVASNITAADTVNWNNKLDDEIDGSVTNEIQDLSQVLAQNNDADSRQIKNVADPADPQDVVTLSYLDTYTHEGLAEQDLLLWNKLGSEAEVTASETGENGELVGTGHAYETARFGNGYVRTDVSSYVKFPQSVLENCRSRGTLEFWINPKVTNPLAFSYGAFMPVGLSINGSGAFAFVRWGDGTTGQGICGGINFDGTLHRTPDEDEQFVATIGTPFHIALVWDVEGIDGTTETIRIYRDGAVIGISTETWDDNSTVTYDNFYIGTSPDGGGYDKYIMDNIKVWKYAKTDYSDIEVENISGLYTAGEGIDITDNVISLSDVRITSDIDANLLSSGTKTNAIVDLNSTGYAAALFLADDGNYEEADADDAASMPCLALCLGTGTGTKDILLHGYIRNDAWSWTIGAPVYVSETAGELTQTMPTTTGQQVQIVGYATATNILYFNPDLTLIELK